MCFPVCPLSEVNLYSCRPSEVDGLSALLRLEVVRISEVRNTLFIWADQPVPWRVSVIRTLSTSGVSVNRGSTVFAHI